MRTLIICLFFVAAGVAKSQPLLLYKAVGTHGKYVISRCYQEGDKSNVSEVIMAETFVIEPSGMVCLVTMSNALVYRTKINGEVSSQSTNRIAQNKMLCEELKIVFPKETKLIYNSSEMELSQAKLGAENKPKMVHYEGEALEQLMKKDGLVPPDDADVPVAKERVKKGGNP
jgi:hypothetical protein